MPVAMRRSERRRYFVASSRTSDSLSRSKIIVGADLRVCPSLHRPVASGSHTQVCPYAEPSNFGSTESLKIRCNSLVEVENTRHYEVIAPTMLVALVHQYAYIMAATCILRSTHTPHWRWFSARD